MTDVASAPAVDSSPAPANDLTPTDLGNLFAEARQKPDDAPETAAPEANSAPEAESAAPVEDPGNKTEEAEPADLPPIERPRSWSKDDDDDWNALPRARQEKIAANERAREADIRQRINDAAEERKAAKAELEVAEKARKEYEAKLPTLMQTLQEAGPFSDIRSMADVEKLQQEDPFRFQAFQLHQWKLQAAQAELTETKARQDRERHTEWTAHVQKENDLAVEFIPELADKDKGPALTNRVATEILPEYGFKPSDLEKLANGSEKLSIYDHRLQRLFAVAVKYADIQKAKVVAAPKPAPAVQKPGTSKPQGAAQSETYTKLSANLERSGDPKDLGALIGHLRRA
jgi:hypothetical protein